MNRSPLKAAAAAAAVLALTVTGCGGDDDKPAASPTDPTATATGNTDPAFLAYKSEAEKICQEAYGALRQKYADLTADASAAQIKEALTSASTRYLEVISGLKALTPPADYTDSVNTWLVDFTKAANTLKGKSKVATTITAPLAKADDQALALGLDRCQTGSE